MVMSKKMAVAFGLAVWMLTVLSGVVVDAFGDEPPRGYLEWPPPGRQVTPDFQMNVAWDRDILPDDRFFWWISGGLWGALADADYPGNVGGECLVDRYGAWEDPPACMVHVELHVPNPYGRVYDFRIHTQSADGQRVASGLYSFYVTRHPENPVPVLPVTWGQVKDGWR